MHKDWPAMAGELSAAIKEVRLGSPEVMKNFSAMAAAATAGGALDTKTKELLAKLKAFELTDVLIISEEVDENLFLAARNLYKVDVRDVAGIDPVSLVAFDKVLITAGAVKQLEERLA